MLNPEEQREAEAFGRQLMKLPEHVSLASDDARLEIEQTLKKRIRKGNTHQHLLQVHGVRMTPFTSPRSPRTPRQRAQMQAVASKRGSLRESALRADDYSDYNNSNDYAHSSEYSDYSDPNESALSDLDHDELVGNVVNGSALPTEKLSGLDREKETKSQRRSRLLAAFFDPMQVEDEVERLWHAEQLCAARIEAIVKEHEWLNGQQYKLDEAKERIEFYVTFLVEQLRARYVLQAAYAFGELMCKCTGARMTFMTCMKLKLLSA